jgi:hypothetical protein
MEKNYYFLRQSEIKIKDIEYLFESLVEPDFPDDSYNSGFTFVAYRKTETLRLNICVDCGKCKFFLKTKDGLELDFQIDQVTHIWREKEELYFFEQNTKLLTLTFNETLKIDIHKAINDEMG